MQSSLEMLEEGQRIAGTPGTFSIFLREAEQEADETFGSSNSRSSSTTA